jgi:hypothetical protein
MKQEPARTTPPHRDDGDPQAALRAQILASEHWSLLATRSITWQEIFSRTAIFLTVLSAAVVALSLVVQADGFGESFHTFALVVLPIVFIVGLATYIRLVEADIEDAWLVIGMNRLRHGYLELAPDLEPYFTTGLHDDEPSILQTYTFRTKVGVAHLLSGSPMIIGVIESLVGGVLAAVACRALGGTVELQVVSGVVVALGTAAALGNVLRVKVRRLRRDYHPRFPGTGDHP